MDNPYDQFITGTPPPDQGPQPAPLPPANPYEQFTSGAPQPAEAPPPAPLNKVFGELKPAQPQSWSDWLRSQAQDAFIGMGVDPYRARHMGNAAVGIPTTVNPAMGAILSAADLSYNLPRGNFGASAIDALGALPGVSSARRLIGRAAPEITPAFEAPFRETARGAPQPGGFVTPSEQELRSAGTQQYRTIENAPIVYHPDAMGDVTRVMGSILPNPRVGPVFTPEKAPAVFSTIDRFNQAFPSGGMRPVTATDFDTLRQQLRGLPEGIGTANGPAGRQAIDVLDSYMVNPPPGALRQGTPQQLAELRANLADARGNWRALRTSEGVTDAIDAARVTTDAANSGMNLGNRTRQELAKFVKSPQGEKKLFGATPAELQSIEDAVAGDRTTNALRYGSNLLGGGGGAGQTLIGSMGAGAGAYLAHSLGLGAPAAVAATMAGGAIPTITGRAMRNAANARTAAAGEDVAAEIRRSSPLSRERAALPENQPIADPRVDQRDLISNAIMQQTNPAIVDWWNRQYVPYANR